MSQKQKTSIVLEERHREWLQAEGGISEAIALLVEQEQARRDQAARAAERERKKLKPRERLLDAVAEFYYPRQAARAAGVKLSVLTKWLENDDFLEELIERQQEFLEGLEVLIIEAARGRRAIDRSAMDGLKAFLGNHAPNWGRGRVDEMIRQFDPIFKDFLDKLKSRVSGPVYREMAEEFGAMKEARFASIRG